jgi:hypothetical protein
MQSIPIDLVLGHTRAKVRSGLMISSSYYFSVGALIFLLGLVLALGLF